MFDNFIGIYDNAVSPQLCDSFIEHFENLEKLNLTFDRKENGNNIKTEKDDETAFLLHSQTLKLNSSNPLIGGFTNAFWPCYQNYVEKYPILKQHRTHGILFMVIHKTKPGEGYHVWHCENMAQDAINKVSSFALYLNDVEEGGETEFLYLNKRIKPKKGTIIIWPAGYTHTHRGNPPLSGEKYLLSGHLEYVLA
jgi:hypothetical protein